MNGTGESRSESESESVYACTSCTACTFKYSSSITTKTNSWLIAIGTIDPLMLPFMGWYECEGKA